MEPGSTSIPRRFDLGPVEDNSSATIPFIASSLAFSPHPGKMNHIGAVSRGGSHEIRSSVVTDATSSRVDPSGGNLTARHQAAGPTAANSHPVGYPTTISSEQRPIASGGALAQLPQQKQLALSRTDSQGTSSTNDADPVFTPPASGGRLSPGTGSAQESSQESQLLQLSQIAASQERIPEDAVDPTGDGALSRKRMADGMIKQSRDKSSASPGQAVGHSRNTSTVSIASTAGSRIGEVALRPCFC